MVKEPEPCQLRKTDLQVRERIQLPPSPVCPGQLGAEVRESRREDRGDAERRVQPENVGGEREGHRPQRTGLQHGENGFQGK